MKLHRNSQKRIYCDDAVYFVTCKTSDNYPFFREQVFCDLFVENLRICKELKGFKLFAWILNLDHFHLLIQPNDEFNISEIMRSLKTNSSCDINRTTSPEGAVPAPRLREIYRNKLNIFDYQTQFLQTHPNQNPFPKFHWQKSYHDHIIRNDDDFEYHFEYIKFNPEKHHLPKKWPYIFTNPEYENLNDLIY